MREEKVRRNLAGGKTRGQQNGEVDRVQERDQYSGGVERSGKEDSRNRKRMEDTAVKTDNK